MGKDTVKKFVSQAGMSFVAPSQFQASDGGDTFTLKSPDGHAVIQALVFTSQGSGTLADFRSALTTGLLPHGTSAWQDSPWTATRLGDLKASKRELIPESTDDHRWKLYVIDAGKYYYAINVNTSEAAMELNGDFYESIVATFEGIRE